ncbi:MAG: hypothetical protein HYX26_01135 [Acidobacteriales bacterium]|nr:hypothetical protein [Terriglobales bacterium]
MRILRVLALLVVSSLIAIAQTEPPKPAEPKLEVGRKITQAEAEELFKSLDEILEFASNDTGLPIKEPVKKSMASRAQVESYLNERIADDPDAKRLERSEIVVKKLGLLPPDFELKSFLVKMYKEQVAGYYDGKRKTAFLLDWISPEAQRPVMAHELTHALQDQAVGLEKWIDEARAAARKRGEDSFDVEFDEESSARGAVIEGQGVVVMLDYIMQPAGRTVAQAPFIVDYFKKTMDTLEPGSLAATAPLLIRDSALFPYREGLSFLSALLTAGGKERAFAGALKNPPTTTRNILTPESYLKSEILPPMHVPELKSALGKEWERYDIGSIGQYDVVLLAKQFKDESMEKEVSPAWRGGMYVAAQRKGVTTPLTKDIAIVMVTRWATAADAEKFAHFYERTFAQRYTEAVQSAAGWKTNEGPASVEVKGEYVISMESFPEGVAAKVREATVKSLDDKRKAAAYRGRELGLRIAAPIWAMRQRSGFILRKICQMDLTGMASKSSTSPTSFCMNGSANFTPANIP